MVWVKLGGVGLGGLLALGPSDSLDRAERSVEPGLLGGLNLVEGQTQVVLQVLIKEEQAVTTTSLPTNNTTRGLSVCLIKYSKGGQAGPGPPQSHCWPEMIWCQH